MSLNSLGKKEILQTEQANLQKLQNLRWQHPNPQIFSTDKALDNSWQTFSKPDGSESDSDLPNTLGQTDIQNRNIKPEFQITATPNIVGTTQLERNSNVLDALVQYIPTESITLYVASMSAEEALSSIFPISKESLYWFFCLLTPILFFLIYVGERKNTGLTPFPKWRKLPWWKLVACTIAFAAWALAIPGAPYLNDRGASGGVVAALIALFASTILSLLEPVFEHKSV